MGSLLACADGALAGALALEAPGATRFAPVDAFLAGDLGLRAILRVVAIEGVL